MRNVTDRARLFCAAAGAAATWGPALRTAAPPNSNSAGTSSVKRNPNVNAKPTTSSSRWWPTEEQANHSIRFRETSSITERVSSEHCVHIPFFFFLGLLRNEENRFTFLFSAWRRRRVACGSDGGSAPTDRPPSWCPHVLGLFFCFVFVFRSFWEWTCSSVGRPSKVGRRTHTPPMQVDGTPHSA